MSLSSFFQGKSVLITGGTGSFGRTMARRLLEENQCKKVIIFSRDEWKQSEMRQSDPIFNHKNIRYFLGDIRDRYRLIRAFNEVDIIIHAAALKQVPAAEYNPSEFVQTNVLGAMNIIDMAIDAGVKLVIALSTDKAVNPVNLYGATKLCSDKLFIAGNVYVGARGYPKFSVVRYGNVAGSRGSILPLWIKQQKEGYKAFTLTDKRMTRFWITLNQAVEFVCQSFERMQGGEIFVPKIPSIRLTDLAAAIAPEMPIEVTGIRPGEKLHELMINIDDARHTIEEKDYFTILSEIKQEKAKGTYVSEGFSYTSDANKHWLSVQELKKQVNEYRKGYLAP